MQPSTTHMDFNISAALYFASKANGRLIDCERVENTCTSSWLRSMMSSHFQCWRRAAVDPESGVASWLHEETFLVNFDNLLQQNIPSIFSVSSVEPLRPSEPMKVECPESSANSSAIQSNTCTLCRHRKLKPGCASTSCRLCCEKKQKEKMTADAIVGGDASTADSISAPHFTCPVHRSHGRQATRNA
eukprot:Lankesteria_metandrocarpae@DN7805_c0_g1_i1.p1